ISWKISARKAKKNHGVKAGATDLLGTKAVVLGSDSYTVIYKALNERLAAREAQKEVAFSTGFPANTYAPSGMRSFAARMARIRQDTIRTSAITGPRKKKRNELTAKARYPRAKTAMIGLSLAPAGDARDARSQKTIDSVVRKMVMPRPRPM